MTITKLLKQYAKINRTIGACQMQLSEYEGTTSALHYRSQITEAKEKSDKLLLKILSAIDDND